MSLRGSTDGSRVGPIIRALRPHHWAKNALVFLPVLLAHVGEDVSNILHAFVAFVAFSLVASSVYVTNDLADMETDRRHPTKRSRPFASGALPSSLGPPLALVLLTLGISVSVVFLPRAFTETLITYLALTLLYSFWMKRRLLLDVLLLAALYTLRILGGGRATGIAISEWLLAFSVFFFLSLAFVKRYSELRALGEEDDMLLVAGRSYKVTDLSVIETVGPTAGYLAVLVLALYVNSEPVTALYSNTAGLWLVCPLLLYWITRIWFLAKRGDIHEDPIVFALTDRVSLLAGVLVVVLVGMAALGLGPRFN
jgi:4-hydroxybenzoate polyprenyltransferase